MIDTAPLSDDIGFLLTRAGTSMTQAATTALAPFDLRVRSYSVLALACEGEDGIGQRRIAEKLGLDPSQIVALVDDLEDRGLISRTVDPDDRRHKRISATTEGRTLCADAQHALGAVQAKILNSLDDNAVRRLRRVLQSLVP